MAFWVDGFQRRMSPKWTSTRISLGGQNDGTWTSDTKDNKLYWKATSLGTETNWWGEVLRLPVSAPGDVTVEAEIRFKRTAGLEGTLGILIDHGATRHGVILGYEANNEYFGRNTAGGRTIWPGTPGPKDIMSPSGSDNLLRVRIVRKNGYLFLYAGDFYVGQYAYANTITGVNIENLLRNNAGDTEMERWVHVLRVNPREVVL